MKLLIVTQAVDLDDPVLGFFHRWIEEFSKYAESVEVICLKEGRHELPKNVRVHSLGKEKGRPPFGRLTYAARFLRLNKKLRNDYDSVFVHMNPEYVILGCFRWRRAHKKVVLWYSHRHLGLRFRIAKLFVNKIATAARETLGIKSKKIVVCGHGIDLEPFLSVEPHTVDTERPKIVTIGRITKIKNIDTIIRAISLLRFRGVEASLDIIGASVTKKDHEYENLLHELVKKLDLDSQVSFLGAVPHEKLPIQLSQYDISVNASPTGGVDKVVLESMASGLLVTVSNLAFKDYFEELFDQLTFAEKDENSLTKSFQALLSLPNISEVRAKERDLALHHASVQAVISKILHQFDVH